MSVSLVPPDDMTNVTDLSVEEDWLDLAALVRSVDFFEVLARLAGLFLLAALRFLGTRELFVFCRSLFSMSRIRCFYFDG